MLKPVDGQQPVNLQPTKPVGPEPTVGPATALSFARQMQTTHHKVGESTLVAFLAEIDEQGKRLVRHPIRGEIERYRSLVGKYIKEAMDQMTTLDKKTDRRNRAFTLIKEVDKKLIELTELLLGGQGKQIDILAKLNEIHGMLVDLKI